MSDPIRYLGIVPARAGSKGIPGKNLADLGGKPMLQWTLEAALGSRRLDGRILTSDDERALALAADLDFPAVRRPAELATDGVSALGAILHALDEVEQRTGAAVENLVVLQPTSPFRDAADVDAAIEAFEASGRATLVSVAPVSQHPCEMLRVVDGRLEAAVEWPPGATGRQGLPAYVFVNGAIFVVGAEDLRQHGVFQDADSALYVMEPSHSLDIDEPFDLDLARGLHAIRV